MEEVIVFENGNEMMRFLKDKLGISDVPGIIFSNEFSLSYKPETEILGFTVEDKKITAYYKVKINEVEFVISTGGEVMFYEDFEDLIHQILNFKKGLAFFDLLNCRVYLLRG